ncbi:hypothetical protein POM88_001690 [Heracleum sosnowskyi]|uniref:Uncharacterized protein n=1 Tax=Heracleum sosnowskyi TaxID=360622 RepID=A0AAD8JGL9_9APIA|nr:hypothetical protein POM88_001690 [Heracleum sosnowskyi]
MASSSSSSSPPSRNAAVSPPRITDLSTVLSLSCKIDDDVSDDLKKLRQAVDDASSLVGWWSGISGDGKDPYGHIIHISAEHGKYLARSYTPWQLATSREGTPLFEIYITPGQVGEVKDQAIYLKHKAAAQDGKGIDFEPDLKPLSMPKIDLTPVNTNMDMALGGIANFLVALNPMNATNPIMHMALSQMRKMSGEDSDGKVKTAIWIDFAIGNFKDKNEKDSTEMENELRRVPAALQRKGCFSFCLTVEEDEEQQSGKKILKEYRAIDHVILDIADCLGKGEPRKNEDQGKFKPLMCSQALKPPVLSGLTAFNKIMVTTSSDPLTGLYTASNGYLVTEVIQFTRKFGQWQGNGETEGPSKVESYDYVEAIKLTGDPDVPAGQETFRARVGDKYKLPPQSVLEDKFGAVARYKGEGRLTGFQKSKWVDVEVFIIGEEYRRDGFALGFLYSASKYHVLKLFKQLSLPSFEESL